MYKYQLTDTEIKSLAKSSTKLSRWFEDNKRNSSILAGALAVAEGHSLNSEDALKLAICALIGKNVEYDMSEDR